jgi:hypothetical protein
MPYILINSIIFQRLIGTPIFSVEKFSSTQTMEVAVRYIWLYGVTSLKLVLSIVTAMNASDIIYVMY